MATSEVLTASEHGALDQVLRPHLRLEPVPEQPQDAGTQHDKVTNPGMRLDQSFGAGMNSRGSKELQRSPSKSSSVEASRPFSRPTVHQSTAEADNKRRPGVLRRNSSRYQSPSPEPLDPNSEAKSQTIRRMQSSLEDWDKQLEEIVQKKSQYDSVTRSEIDKKDKQVEEITKRYTSEREVRLKTEQERENLATELRNTSEELEENKHQTGQLQSSLGQYELAYKELDENKRELEAELETANEQLQKSEGMRRRLNDQVTELQGQLAIEEQRSRFCSIL